MKIGVIVRVYDRIEDLKVCLDILRRSWVRHDYHVIVAANGARDGHRVPESCGKQADQIVELEDNAGILAGNAQLLSAGISRLPSDCEYAVLLEADTWVLSDAVIDRYLRKMGKTRAVWASAEWIEKYHSLATDFAIAETAFLKSNPKICRYTEHAESFVCNYLRAHKQRYLFITECMPVHIPNFLRRFYNPYGGRMRSFTRVPMVTHHVEDLPGGIDEKKKLANIAAGRIVFDNADQQDIKKEYRQLKRIEALVKIMPRSRWFKPKKTRKM